jgi:hypothetical protein
MSVLVSIAGLAFLILIHEAGTSSPLVRSGCGRAASTSASRRRC